MHIIHFDTKNVLKPPFQHVTLNSGVEVVELCFYLNELIKLIQQSSNDELPFCLSFVFFSNGLLIENHYQKTLLKNSKILKLVIY